MCLPLLYGASWFSKESTDHDGSMTRFVGHHAQVTGGMGLGHQDFTCEGRLFGLGSVQRIDFPLDAGAPDFEARCIRRGLDPVAMRALPRA